MFEIEKVKKIILDVPNFPKEGIIFKDITPIFKHPDVLDEIITQMSKIASTIDFDVIVAPESRGYLFGVPSALKMNKPFVFARKKGKLPRETVSVAYQLEYNVAEIEIHKQDILQGQKVLIVDDLLATGGTIRAIEELIQKMGAKPVGNIFLIELGFLNGETKLIAKTHVLIKY
ncbi:adenine phosphoribosyltransferase [bacterium]|nr:adenine phosphoribosyltransferase [bacterium]